MPRIRCNQTGQSPIAGLIGCLPEEKRDLAGSLVRLEITGEDQIPLRLDLSPNRGIWTWELRPEARFALGAVAAGYWATSLLYSRNSQSPHWRTTNHPIPKDVAFAIALTRAARRQVTPETKVA